MTECNTESAPWYVVPADRKWFRNLLVAEIVAETLEKMGPRYPKVEWDPTKVKIV